MRACTSLVIAAIASMDPGAIGRTGDAVPWRAEKAYDFRRGVDGGATTVSSRWRARDAILKSAADRDMDALVKDVLSVAARTDERVVVRPSPRIPTAVTMETSGTPVILYNPTFLARLSRAAKTDWAIVFIVAHETAHHLVAHLTARQPVPRDTRELEADEIAGFVLAALGASHMETTEVVTAAAQLTQSSVPTAAERLAAVERGWRTFNGLVR